MNITVNGQPTSVEDQITVAALVTSRNLPATGVAVARNGEVVGARSWETCLLVSGDAVEIVTARQGG